MTADPETLDQERLRRLLDVGRGLVAQLDLEAVLGRVLEVARELTGARYAALGILDEQRRELERFLYVGIDEDTRETIGDLPRGRGILGVLIEDPRPLRLEHVGDHPRSYGFPLGHPPMDTFLGVPIVVRGEAYGNLYLTEKEGGAAFTDADEASIVVLADWAAIAIDNARLYAQVDRRRAELERAVRGLEATTAIARAVGGETELERVLELIVKRGRALVDARTLLILLRDGDELEVSAVAGEAGAAAVGQRVSVAGSLVGDVLASGRAERVEGEPGRLGSSAGGLGGDARNALLAPLTFRGRRVGVLAAFERGDGRPFDLEDERMVLAFAASAATAVHTARSVEQQRLRHALESAEQERRRWARELHDETLQALGGLRIMLSSARRNPQPERVADVLDQALEHVDGEIHSLRALIRELRPAALDDLGLKAAVEELAGRQSDLHGVPITARVDTSASRGEATRLELDDETAVYRIVQEAVTNALRHAQAEHVTVDVGERDERVEIAVSDDGRGFDPEHTGGGFGLAGMRERVELLGGRLDIRSSAEGTTVRASLPVRRRVEDAGRATGG